MRLRNSSTLWHRLQRVHGDQFQQKRKQRTRKHLIRNVTTGILAVPSKLAIYRNIFMHPLKEQDVWSVEYARELYQRAGEYQQSIHIFQTEVREYAHQHSSAEIVQLKAKALGYLGVIYTNRMVNFPQPCQGAMTMNTRRRLRHPPLIPPRAGGSRGGDEDQRRMFSTPWQR